MKIKAVILSEVVIYSNYILFTNIENNENNKYYNYIIIPFPPLNI